MDALGILVQGMQLNEKVLHYQSLNLVNMQTPSYRRAKVNFSSMLNQQLTGNELPGNPAVTYDSTAGAFISTGEPLDVYLQPNIYMTAKDGQQTIYSRNGHLAINADGALTDGQGKVIAAGGKLSHLQQQKLRITADGTVWNGEEKVTSINLVKIDNPVIDADGYVRHSENYNAVRTNQALISGGLEGSNTSFTDEVVGIMQQVRTVTGLQYAYKSIDGLFDKALTELGHF